MPLALRQAVPACGGKTLWAVRQHMPSSPWRQICSPHYPPHVCLPVRPLHCRAHLTTQSSRSQLMPCKSYTKSYHNTSQHIPPYQHSQESFYCLFPGFPPHTLPITPESHAPLRMCLLSFVLDWLLLVRFCSRFVFVF